MIKSKQDYLYYLKRDQQSMRLSKPKTWSERIKIYLSPQ